MLRIAMVALAVGQSAAAQPTVLIERTEIEHSGAHDLTDLLRQLPLLPAGMQGRDQLNLRAAGAVRSVLLVDGERVPVDPGSGITTIPALPLALIERVEWTSSVDEPLGAINVVLRQSAGVDVAVSEALPDASGEQRSIAALAHWSDPRWNMHVRLARSERNAFAQRDDARGLLLFPYANDFLVDTAIAFGPAFPLSNLSFGSVVPGGCVGPGFQIEGSGRSQRCNYDEAAVSDQEPTRDQSFAQFSTRFAFDERTAVHASVEAARRDTEAQLAPVWNFFPEARFFFVPPTSPNHPARRAPGAGYDASLGVWLLHRFAGLAARQDVRRDDRLTGELGVEHTWGDWQWQTTLRHNQSDYRQINRGEVNFAAASRAIVDGSYDIYTFSGPALATIGATLQRDAEGAESSLRNELSWQSDGATLVAHLDYWRERVDDHFDNRVLADQVSSPNLGVFDVLDASARRDGVVAGLDYRLVGEGWTSALSLQHDQRDDIDSEISALLRIDTELTPTWRAHAQASSGFRAPQLRLQNFTPVVRSGGVFDPVFDVFVQPVPLVLVPNPELQAERLQQLALGLRWQPAATFGVGLDVWQQQVDDVIRLARATELVNCAAGLERNCPSGNLRHDGVGIDARRGIGVLRRRTDPNPNFPFPAQATIEVVQTGYINAERIRLRGVDLSAHWQREFGTSTLRQSAWLAYAEYEHSDEFVFEEEGFADQRARIDTSIAWPNWRVGWTLNYIGKNRNGSIERGSYVTHDLTALWRAPWDGEFTVGVENLFDRAPPLSAFDADFALYDGVGRTPFVRYAQRW